jgi:transcriptional regulator with XRE-family HTH domain
MSDDYTEQDLLDACINPGPGIFVSFGGVVADFRKRAGMKQKEFADLIGVSRGYLAAIENNKAPNLGLKVVEQIAKQMHVDRIALARLWYQTKDALA